ncbi:hypothetical protein AALP_AA8G483500 [Arabis alpina]|uniref:No apical meristem-associated C-terminal domain-containing protein n=1 Tax=Arabis alpina TaxID=50452 RepID=A0A087GE85_ARAAL|nr:hypothetical protein AALP_AA8G483500 [Arabis alpina]
MARTQKNKVTEYHLGQLKVKIAKLRTQLLEPPKGASGGGEGFEVTKYGHGRVALIGFPRSIGLDTYAYSYPFTSSLEIAGLGHKQILAKELEAVGLRLNKKPPQEVKKVAETVFKPNLCFIKSPINIGILGLDDYFAASPSVAELPPREANTCKQKWRKVSESVSKFGSCLDYATRNPQSGRNDPMEVAHEMYLADTKLKFTLEHAWKLLRTDQKWALYVTQKTKRKKKKKQKTGEPSSSNMASHVVEERQERPVGVKAAKASQQRREQAFSGLKEAWVIKKEDLAAKERLSNKKILETLLAKPEPTQMELTLMNQLMLQMSNYLGQSQ